jgi:hypothetical protein
MVRLQGYAKERMQDILFIKIETNKLFKESHAKHSRVCLKKEHQINARISFSCLSLSFFFPSNGFQFFIELLLNERGREKESERVRERERKAVCI